METRYRVLPAVRGYKVYDEQTGRTLSLHERRDDAIHRADTLARAEHIEVEVLDENGDQVAHSSDFPGPISRRMLAAEGTHAGAELVDEPGMERLDDDPVLEMLDEMM